MKRIVLLLETSREFGRQLIIGIAHYSRLHGPWTFYKEPVDLKSSIPHLTSWKPEGIIMRDSLITEELLKLKIPTILAIHDSKYPKDLPVIKTDSYAIAQMASKHFIEKGFKNLAFCGFDIYDWSEGRKYFFSQFNDEAGIKTYNFSQLKKLRKQNWDIEQRHVMHWIRELPKPVGIFACNDDRGQNILEVCKLVGLKVPDDVAVIGVDNDPMICDTGDPPLTSIALNVETAGFEAASLLDQLFRKNKVLLKEIMVTPSHIVQRQSSDILAVDDTEVAKAIHYIKSYAKKKIFIRDIVKTASVSRRTLEKRFRKTIHRSIYNEIQQVRIDWISKLLAETNLPISQITSFFDFTDSEHISRYFKMVKGISLREFRKLHRPY